MERLSCPHTKDGRPCWDCYFVQIARDASQRADCRRARHGAVITVDNRIVATGYNGGPSGGASCLAGECPRGKHSYADLDGHERGNHDYSSCVALHAEQNAITYARCDLRGATLYLSSAPPCDMCSKLIKAAGITRVFTGNELDADLRARNLERSVELRNASREAVHNIESLYGEGCLDKMDITAMILHREDDEHWPGWHLSHVVTPDHALEFWPLNGFYSVDGDGKQVPEQVIQYIGRRSSAA